ncbi:MAG: hypothetical protein ACW99U_20815 [Candidatus Thorarchaeota archaeon]|jgi:hypothetical protein
MKTIHLKIELGFNEDKEDTMSRWGVEGVIKDALKKQYGNDLYVKYFEWVK